LGNKDDRRKRLSHRNSILYVVVLAGCLAVGWSAGWTAFGVRINHSVYDVLTTFLLRVDSASVKVDEVAVVAIDPETLTRRGGMRGIRTILAGVLDDLAQVKPRVVISDVVLADPQDPAEDARLAAALLATKNLVMPCQIVNGKWEDPLPIFRDHALALGHVYQQHPGQVNADGVNRSIPLEEIADSKARWALALEAFAAYRGQVIVQSPDDVQIGNTIIPAARHEDGRPMYIRYLPPAMIPVVPALEILEHKDKLRDRAVFLGITANYDRQNNPFGDTIPGVQIHAEAFETMMRGNFLTPASDSTVVALCIVFAVAAGLIFAFFSGWTAYSLDILLLLIAHVILVVAFRQGTVFPYFGPVSVAWLASAGAAIFQHFFVRRQLRTSESEKSRYQQAIHWVAHEMRTPLTAIQGSSEIMTRYKLPEEKGKQLSEMINSESKRLARMIQTFLDVERLADGQMELKKESFAAGAVVDSCLKRVRPIADGKNIRILLDGAVEADLIGDRELMEYAFYNLLTNAVKYSPADTEIHVSAAVSGGEMRLSVRDQGIGMDAQELKSIFKKFYRTKRAEASGEVGTGIGLSIVEQIVTHHDGRMEVTSEPGKGSCFTIIMSASNPKVPPAAENSADSHNAETSNR
jgi:signal transduction histidine kinase